MSENNIDREVLEARIAAEEAAAAALAESETDHSVVSAPVKTPENAVTAADKAMANSSAKIRRSKIFRTCVLVFLAILSIFPFYLMFVNATRTSDQIKAGIDFVFGSNLMNNIATFNEKQQGVGITVYGSMLNSLIISLPATALSVYFSALTAYGMHAYEFKGKKFLWGFIMAVMMVPNQVFAVGFYKMMLEVGLIDTYWPLILPSMATPVVVFFMRQYLKGALPLEIVEAARIDGSGEFKTFNRVVLPILAPAMATQAIFQFVANWNNLFIPSMIINSTDKKTLTMFVQLLMGDSFKTDYGVVFLALSITILPMFVIYFILSRYIVEGVALGSVKE